jgi:hypothetical protein
MINDYRELDVWQMSMTLCEKVYAHIRSFPQEERKDLDYVNNSVAQLSPFHQTLQKEMAEPRALNTPIFFL